MGLRGKQSRGPSPEFLALSMKILRQVIHQAKPTEFAVIAKKVSMDKKIAWRIIDRSDLLIIRNNLVWVTEKGVRVYLGREVVRTNAIKRGS